jgi:hypothetical protein
MLLSVGHVRSEFRLSIQTITSSFITPNLKMYLFQSISESKSASICQRWIYFIPMMCHVLLNISPNLKFIMMDCAVSIMNVRTVRQQKTVCELIIEVIKTQSHWPTHYAAPEWSRILHIKPGIEWQHSREIEKWSLILEVVFLYGSQRYMG